MVINGSESVEEQNIAYRVIEQFLVAKTGHAETCEDELVITPHFVAVIDGATSKTERRWDGLTGGRMAAQLIKAAFAHLEPDVTARQAVNMLTSAIHTRYKQDDLLETVQADPTQRMVASFVAFSLTRHEIWMVGDCQCLLNQQLVTNGKAIDAITANARSMFLETEIARGKTLAELLQNDTGREFIRPLLERQMTFQNNPAAGQYWFAVIDGFMVPDDGVHVFSLPAATQSIVLASDGYPFLQDTLEASEQALQALLQDDPLLFRMYKSTKGIRQGNFSFDDRTYVKLVSTQAHTESNSLPPAHDNSERTPGSM
jgi:hypothetical protein